MDNKTTQIVFDVELDENHVPEKMSWKSTDNGEGGDCKAALISIWDEKTENTLKIDLWTKKLTVDDMNKLIHQTIHTLGDSYLRATDNKELSTQMKEFARFFGEETGLLNKD